jgi:hypothetical protein
MPFDFDLTDVDDLTLIVAAVDDDPAGDGPGLPGPPLDPRPRSGCAGCGCTGCLLPALVIAAAAAGGFGALPVAAGLGIGVVLLSLAGSPAGAGC